MEKVCGNSFSVVAKESVNNINNYDCKTNKTLKSINHEKPANLKSTQIQINAKQ